MMVVCIELRIPLFLVGKPGSSKSLAKTIVADAMQGNAAHTEVYRNYKQVKAHTQLHVYNNSFAMTGNNKSFCTVDSILIRFCCVPLQVQMVSFQCSPLSVPEGIVGTFRQCAMYQKDKDLNRFVSVVVLDEVGLAEDSPRMPLKVRDKQHAAFIAGQNFKKFKFSELRHLFAIVYFVPIEVYFA